MFVHVDMEAAEGVDVDIFLDNLISVGVQILDQIPSMGTTVTCSSSQ